MTTTIIQTNGTVLYESQAGTMSEAITEAIRAGVSLAGANLAYATLARATLTGANLYNANLTDTTFARVANITDSCSAIGIIDAGTDSRGYRWVAVQHDDGPRIYAGCRWFTLSEAHAHWDREHADGEDVAIECRARLALLETLITTKGW